MRLQALREWKLVHAPGDDPVLPLKLLLIPFSRNDSCDRQSVSPSLVGDAVSPISTNPTAAAREQSHALSAKPLRVTTEKETHPCLIHAFKQKPLHGCS